MIRDTPQRFARLTRRAQSVEGAGNVKILRRGAASCQAGRVALQYTCKFIRTGRAQTMMYNPQLETFLCVADAGSFNKAAATLYITPTVERFLEAIRQVTGAGEELPGGR